MGEGVRCKGVGRRIREEEEGERLRGGLSFLRVGLFRLVVSQGGDGRQEAGRLRGDLSRDETWGGVLSPELRNKSKAK